jgi:ACS family glucarate transporter-like MFS transporter
LTRGWRAAFSFEAVLGTLAATLWWIIARDRPEDHPRVSPAEQQEIHQVLTSFANTAGAA